MKSDNCSESALTEGFKNSKAAFILEAFEQFVYPLAVFDNKRNVIGLNKAAEKLFGVSVSKFKPQLCTDLFECDRAGHHCHLNNLFTMGVSDIAEQVTIIDAEGKPVHLHVTISPITDESGAFIGAFEMFRRMEDIENVSRGIIEKAMTDQLTGLGNRRKLYEALDIESSRAARHKRPYSVLLADIDMFKEYNDTHGHLEGDTALRFVAKTLAESSRKEDTVTRFGGEEFVALLPETDAEGAVAQADRLRRLIEKKSENNPKLKSQLRISIGASTCQAGEKCAFTTLISRADKALYTAKRGGRNRVAHADAFDDGKHS